MKRSKLKKQSKGNKPKGKSKYRKKMEILHKSGLWGFEVPDPKPWK